MGKKSAKRYFGKVRRAKRFMGTRMGTPYQKPTQSSKEDLAKSVSVSSKKLRVAKAKLVEPEVPEAEMLVPECEPRPTGTFSGMALHSRPTSGNTNTSTSISSTKVFENKCWELQGNRIIKCDRFVSLMSQLKCPKCDSALSVTEFMNTRKGLVTTITARCVKCVWHHHLSNSYDTQEVLLNTLSILASRMIG